MTELKIHNIIKKSMKLTWRSPCPVSNFRREAKLVICTALEMVEVRGWGDLEWWKDFHPKLNQTTNWVYSKLHADLAGHFRFVDHRQGSAIIMVRTAVMTSRKESPRFLWSRGLKCIWTWGCRRRSSIGWKALDTNIYSWRMVPLRIPANICKSGVINTCMTSYQWLNSHYPCWP